MPAWPQAALHTQWPGTGGHGDAVFDQFFASQYAGMAASPQEELTARALVALLKKIGPAVLLTHSQSGPHGWDVADAVPALVKAIVVRNRTDRRSIRKTTPASIGPGHYPSAHALQPAVPGASDLRVIQEPVADGPGRFKCWKQAELPRQLVNLRGISF
jgi:pimeloyl-ACP methyl ester carboxylesterase